MRSDDITVIHSKLKTDGLCSPKMLIDATGWPSDGPSNRRLAEIMDYLVGIGEAEIVPEGWWALDHFGKRMRRRLSTPLPRVKHPELVEKAEVKMPAKSSYDRAKASTILALIRSGQPICKACKEAGVPESTFKRWRSSNHILNGEAKAAVKIAGNSPAEKAAAKYAQIIELLKKGYTIKRVMAELRCAKFTIRLAKDAMAEGAVS